MPIKRGWFSGLGRIGSLRTPGERVHYFASLIRTSVWGEQVFMSGCRALILIVVGVLLVHPSPAAEKPKPLRYLRLAKDQFVLESEITESRTADGATFVSLTDRGSEKMTLTLHFDKNQRLTRAETLQETEKGKQSAILQIEGTTARLTRTGVTDLLKAEGNPIVTTAPDWSDILQLARRYDAKKGGRQEFAGLWIHPSRPPLQLTFSIDRVGADHVTVGEKKHALERYRIRLRSGDYLTWADSAGKVYKLMPAGKPAAAVVLEGFQEATRDLGK